MALNSEGLLQVLRDIMREELDKRRNIDFYIVTGVDETKYTANIRHLNIKTLTYDEVPIASIGLGHLKAGIMVLPEIDDIVIAGFLDDTPVPIILGSVFDTFTQTPDTLPQISKKSLLITNQKQGAIVFLNSNNEVLLATPDRGTSIKIKDGEVIVTSTAKVTVDASDIQLASGSNGFARVGDAVQVSDPVSGTLSGTITSGSSIVKGGD